jgi:gas vesicle protein
MKCKGLLAFVGGALAGAAAAILLAPDSGENTRKKLKEKAQREYDHLKDKLARVKAECGCDGDDCIIEEQ